MNHNDAVIAALPLIAREVEVAAIYALVDKVKQGRGGAIVITGESGIGKTRLLVEAHLRADQHGLLVLRGRAVESGAQRGACRVMDHFQSAHLVSALDVKASSPLMACTTL